MVRTIPVGAAGLSVFISVVSACGVALAAKDQSRIDETARVGKPVWREPGLSPGLDFQQPQGPQGPQSPDEMPEEDANPYLGDGAPIETITLTDSIARKALDALVDLRAKYEDDGLLEYETLEAFTVKAKAGRNFLADLAGYGFDTVAQWNAAILSIDFAYGAILDGDEGEVKAQIEDVRGDPNLSEADRKAMIDGLTAMLSTPENKNVVRALMKDATYSVKLKQLDEME